MSKKKILAFFDYFYPSVKSGGPAVSSLGFAERLGENFEIIIFTRNRDFNSSNPYEGILADRIISLKNFSVIYNSTGNEFRNLLGLLREKRFDFFYLNSIYSFYYSILPLLILKFKISKDQKIVLAPRGELAGSAIEHKPIKKKLFLCIYKYFLDRRIVWHATSDLESLDIRKFSKKANVLKAINLRPKSDTTGNSKYSLKKIVGHIRIVTVARIHPIKNIDLALRILSNCKGQVTYDLYGFNEEKEYLVECMKIAETLPPNISFNYKGELSHGDVINVIKQYHLFLLLSKGENFGHAIYESLIGNRPVLISDKTYFKSLDKYGIGWDLPLHNIQAFIRIINQLIQYSDKEMNKMYKDIKEYMVKEDFHAEIENYISIFS